jgi:hypothetical protein
MVLWGGVSTLEVSNMSETLISRRGAFSLVGLAALGFALPATVLTTSEDAEAQAQPATPASVTPAPGGPAPLTRRQQRRAARQQGREMRREARRNARQMRREARRNARQMRREARRGMFMRANTPTKQ